MAEGPEQFVPTFLTAAEQEAVVNAHTLATAESIISFGGLLLAIGTDPEMIPQVASGLRDKLADLSLQEVRELSGSLADISAKLPLRSAIRVTANVAETHQAPALRDPLENVADAAPEASVVEPAQPLASESEVPPPAIEDRSVPDVQPEPTPQVESDVPAEAQPAAESVEPDIQPDVPAVLAKPAAKEGLAPGGGRIQLKRLFGDVLSESDIVHLQSLDLEGRERFLAVVADVYERQSSKPRFKDVQVNRIRLLIEQHTPREIAEITAVQESAVLQIVYSLSKIFPREADTIRAAVKAETPAFTQPDPASAVDETPVAIPVTSLETPSPGPTIESRDNKLDDEPIHVKVAARLIESLGIDASYAEAARSLLDPKNRGEMTEAKLYVTQVLREYILVTYGDIPSSDLDLAGPEQAHLRRLTGLFFNNGRPVVRPSQQLARIVSSFKGNPHQRDKVPDQLYSAIEKLLDAKTADLQPAHEKAQAISVLERAVMEPGSVERATWLKTAKQSVETIGQELRLGHEAGKVLWLRAHRDETGAHTEDSPELRAVLRRVQAKLVDYRSKLQEDGPEEAMVAFKMFVLPFNGPKDLDHIDNELTKQYGKTEPNAEQYIAFMLSKMLSYMQDEARGVA